MSLGHNHKSTCPYACCLLDLLTHRDHTNRAGVGDCWRHAGPVRLGVCLVVAGGRHQLCCRHHAARCPFQPVGAGHADCLHGWVFQAAHVHAMQHTRCCVSCMQCAFMLLSPCKLTSCQSVTRMYNTHEACVTHFWRPVLTHFCVFSSHACACTLDKRMRPSVGGGDLVRFACSWTAAWLLRLTQTLVLGVLLHSVTVAVCHACTDLEAV